MASTRLGEERRLTQETLGYWTPERMASAIPAGITDPGPELALDRGLLQPLPGKFTTTRIVDPAADVTHRKAGKLFFTLDGEDFQASACAVNLEGILTAAHCLYSTKTAKYLENGMYMPGYQAGISKLGKFPLKDKPFVPDSWKSSGKRAWDYGFSKVARGGPDNDSVLGYVTGIFTVSVNLGKQGWDTLGYPAEPVPDYNFDGEYMWSCLGAYVGEDIPGVMRKEGNLTKGSSGGPWLIPKTHYVNGVQSANNPKYPGQNFSPYFDDAVLELYKKAFL